MKPTTRKPVSWRRVAGKVRSIQHQIDHELANRLAPTIERTTDCESFHLTFDDGPDPDYTVAIAEALEARGSLGTFFLTGSNTKSRPNVARRLDDAGHGIGSHSSTHLPPWQTRRREVADDLQRGHYQVSEVLGRDVQLFRPPYGFHNLTTAEFARRNNLPVYMWTCDPEDWKPDALAAHVADAATAECQPGNIILLHDAIFDNPQARDRSATVDAVARILDSVSATSVPLPEVA